MPVQSKKSPWANKLNAALAGHANDKTKYAPPRGDLPPGINGGIAQLVDAKIGTYQQGNNKGEKFVYLGGVVVEPLKAQVVRQAFVDGKVAVVSSKEEEVAGLRTGMTMPMCETKNASGEVTDLDTNIERLLNELRKVGGEECTAGVSDEASLETLLETLKEAKPYFKFDTSASKPSAQYPTERVWENWRGSKGLEDYQAEDATATATQDDSAGETSEEVPDAQEPAEEGEDLAALAELADNQDTKAMERLKALALEAGIEADAIDNAESWAAVVESMQAEGGGDDAQQEKDWQPVKGEVYPYKAPKAKKALDCEVTAVFEVKQTVNLTELGSKKLYKAVPWSSLEK